MRFGVCIGCQNEPHPAHGRRGSGEISICNMKSTKKKAWNRDTAEGMAGQKAGGFSSTWLVNNKRRPKKHEGISSGYHEKVAHDHYLEGTTYS